MNKLFESHKFAVLQFSGGKDSLACLYMLRDFWDKIIVVWCNTGAAFPETIDQMRAIKMMVPHFVEVTSNQPDDIAINGLPVDLLSYKNTDSAVIYEGKETKKMRIFFDCCSSNIWAPMQNAINELGATLVIRGQKMSDSKKSTVTNGQVVDGIQYIFPLDGMTDDDVFAYLRANSISLPKHYEYVNTSLDCWSCTAYIFDNIGKIKYMKDHHKEKADAVIGGLKAIRDSAEYQLRFIDQAIGE